MRARFRLAGVPVLCVALLVVLLGALRATTALASPPLQELGFGPRATALAGAVVASSDGLDGPIYNPAAVALADGPKLLLGYGYAAMSLRIDGRDAGVNDAHGFYMGTALPVDLGHGVRAAFGLDLYLPDQFDARILLTPASEPHFLLLGNNPDRLVVNPVLSLAPFPWLSVGAGATTFSDTAGHGITFNVGARGAEKIASSALDVGLPTRAAPVAGLLVKPLPHLRFGASYQGEIDLGLRLDVLVNVTVPGVVTGDALLAARAVNFFTPATFRVGGSYDIADRLLVSVEADELHYRAFHGGAPDVKVLVNLGIAPSLVNALLPPDNLHDIVIGRGGLEYHAPLAGGDRLAVRAGYAYVPTPVPPQTGMTSYADCPRHVLAVGGGVTFADPTGLFTTPVSVDASLELHLLESEVTDKNPSTFPGESFTAGGAILAADLAATVGF
jgi:hypothetical protein